MKLVATEDRSVAAAALLVGLFAAILGYNFSDSLAQAVRTWSREEYSHGYLIPVVAALMAYQRLRQVQPQAGQSWLGVGLIACAIALQVVGELTALHVLVQYALLLALFGIVMACLGVRTALVVIVPLAYLAFAIPLPQFLYNGLSTKMQLLSSGLGVSALHAFGLSVYQEGNVIDLGGYKLQVVEACSGLRYLFPLMSFGFLAAYLFEDAWWKRVLVFLSATPITVVMNSLRIAAIGVTVDRWGIAMASGFLHDFEGWSVFLVCVVVLLAEIWVLRHIGSGGRFRLDLFVINPGPLLSGQARVSAPMLASLALLAVTAGGVGSGMLSERAETVPPHRSLAQFPLKIGSWIGRQRALDLDVLDALKLSDYVLVDYQQDGGPAPVNFYVAYYESQRKGAAAHSPGTCIPGGGWEIAEIDTKVVAGTGPDNAGLAVNRAVIKKGDAVQLVYYWFQQRGRILTNEYSVKWYLLADSLTRKRTDGALVRLVTPVTSTQAEAEARLNDFLQASWSRLTEYVPE